MMLAAVCLTVFSIVTTHAFTPLQDGTGTSTAFFFSSTAPASSPFGCIDSCFNNATGGGKEAGCVGIAEQYECICTFPAMMQTFQTCMSKACLLDSVTIQQTLGNVQQVCASCTPDGCNTIKVSASAAGGGTITVSAATLTPVSTLTSAPSLCYSSTQSAWTSSLGDTGGAVGGGIFSAGPVLCPSLPLSSSAASSSPTGVALSDTISRSGNPTSTPSAARGLGPYLYTALIFAVSLGGALVY